MGSGAEYDQNDMSMYPVHIKSEPQHPVPVALSNGYSHAYPPTAPMQQVQGYMVQVSVYRLKDYME
jgi:hypothetical protein